MIQAACFVLGKKLDYDEIQFPVHSFEQRSKRTNRSLFADASERDVRRECSLGGGDNKVVGKVRSLG